MKEMSTFNGYEIVDKKAREIKITLPLNADGTVDVGTSGHALVSNGDGTFAWKSIDNSGGTDLSIKTAELTATTSQYGGININDYLEFHADNSHVISVKAEGYLALPFINGSGRWCCTIMNTATFEAVTNTSVTLYIDYIPITES